MKLDINYLLIGLVVILLATGQILFKLAAKQMISADGIGTFIAVNGRSFGVLLIAALLYVAATAAWIQALRRVPLSTAYMFNAAAFVLVPLLGAMLFDERLPRFFVFGTALIIGGILLIALG
jgi:multidrug transporter EmrE-like cation transporter